MGGTSVRVSAGTGVHWGLPGIPLRPAGPSRRHRVKAVRWRGHLKELSLTGASGPLLVPRSACVTGGDSVEVTRDSVWVICSNGKARISPSYVAREHLKVGGLSMEMIVKEITEADELSAYEALTEFHYRGRSLFGRTSRLIVRCFHPVYPSVVGYVELTTPLYMNKPRSAILDAPFRMNGTSWNRWNVQTARDNINLIVRIARCVVYPEFRGLGLGQMLINHAAAFARERWQVGKKKPYFIEISADMLKFVPFAEKAGMTFIGETEGNLGRVAKDMSYLLKNRNRVTSRQIVREEAFGIVDQQVARMHRAAKLLKRNGWNRNELAQRLARLSEDRVMRDFSLFHEIVSLPKPTYLKGLVPDAQEFLRKRAAVLAPKNSNTASCLKAEPIQNPITANKVCLTFQSRVRRTRRTHAIQQAFGISPDDFSHTVVRDLCLTIKAGEVLLVTGASGSGKSSLLNCLTSTRHPGLSGKLSLPINYRPGLFTSINSQKPLIEILGGADVRSTLQLMGTVGLSDAFVYLKRFNELSNGQQYRAMLAKLISSGTNVWIADEFCANLDVVTAIVVADRLQKVARALKAVLIVASSQPEVFASALNPDKVLQLTTAWEYRLIPGADFIRSIPPQRAYFPAPTLRIDPRQLKSIRAGSTKILRIAHQPRWKKGLLWLVAKRDMELVKVAGFISSNQLKTRNEALAQSHLKAELNPAKQKARALGLTGSTKSIWLQQLHVNGRIGMRNGHVLEDH